jgi:hypothetical protein
MAAVAHRLTYIQLQRHGLLRHQAVTQSAQQWLPCSSYSMQEEPPCTTNDLEVTPVMSQSWCERLGGIGGTGDDTKVYQTHPPTSTSITRPPQTATHARLVQKAVQPSWGLMPHQPQPSGASFTARLPPASKPS